jgi:hypothetical protein
VAIVTTVVATFAAVDNVAISYTTPESGAFGSGYELLVGNPTVTSGAAPTSVWCDTPVDSGGTSTTTVRASGAFTGVVAVDVTSTVP